jgi:hypothetical protein
VTSPYASSLLKEASEERIAVPAPSRDTAHTSMRTVVMPQPMMAPQPVMVMAAPRSGGGTAVLMFILVLVIGVLAAGAGYLIADRTAPTPAEVQTYQRLALRDGVYAGRAQGLQTGREFGAASERTAAQYRALTARQQAWNRGYEAGKRTGLNSWREPRAGGYAGFGYREPRVAGIVPASTSVVAGAMREAQRWTEITGAPVEVEIYD